MITSKSDDVLRLDVTVDPNNPDDTVLDMLQQIKPGWTRDYIKHKVIGEGSGVVNVILLYYVDDNFDDALVMRIECGAFSEYFNPQRIIRSCLLLNEQKISPKLYCLFTNGMCFEYIKGRTYMFDDRAGFEDQNLVNAIGRELAKYHCKATAKLALEKYGLSKEGELQNLIDRLYRDWDPDFVKSRPQTSDPEFPTKEFLLAETAMMKSHLEELHMEKTYAHNDAHPGNCIYSSENDVAMLVDYDLSSFNWPFYDLAYCLLHSTLGIPSNMNIEHPLVLHSIEFQEDFLRNYLVALAELDNWGREVTTVDVQRHMVLLRKMFLYVMLTHIPLCLLVVKNRPKLWMLIGGTLRMWKKYLEIKDEVMALHYEPDAPLSTNGKGTS